MSGWTYRARCPQNSAAGIFVLQPAGREGEGAFSYPGFEALRDQNRVFSDAFTFSSIGASVYQLGSFGTARKELKALTLTP